MCVKKTKAGIAIEVLNELATEPDSELPRVFEVPFEVHFACEFACCLHGDLSFEDHSNIWHLQSCL